MSRVLGIDTETTGLDVSQDRVLEIAAVLMDTASDVPLKIVAEMIHPENHVLEPDYVSPTGLRASDIFEFGQQLLTVLGTIECMIEKHRPVALVGHNIVGYDIPLLKAEIARMGASFPLLMGTPVIDTRHDLPFKKEPSSRRQTHLAADHGILNPFEHRAVFDVMTCLKLLSKYDFQEVLANSKIPWVTLRAWVDYDNNQKAKDLRYSWQKAGDKHYDRAWVKMVRQNAVEREVAAANALGIKRCEPV